MSHIERLTPEELQRWKDQQPGSYQHWLDMQPGMFDTSAVPVQGALFPEPDRCGTPDLFDSQEG